MRCLVLRLAKLTVHLVMGVVLVSVCGVRIALGQAESQSADELGRGTGTQDAPVSVPCPTARSREGAQFLRDENYRRYQMLFQLLGPGDARTQEALGLYNCYRAQVAR